MGDVNTPALWGLIQAHLDEYGVTDAEFARRMHVSPQTLNSWKKRGVRQLPSRDKLDAVAELTRNSYAHVLDAALVDAGYKDELRTEIVEVAIRVRALGPDGWDDIDDLIEELRSEHYSRPRVRLADLVEGEASRASPEAAEAAEDEKMGAAGRRGMIAHMPGTGKTAGIYRPTGGAADESVTTRDVGGTSSGRRLDDSQGDDKFVDRLNYLVRDSGAVLDHQTADAYDFASEHLAATTDALLDAPADLANRQSHFEAFLVAIEVYADATLRLVKAIQSVELDATEYDLDQAQKLFDQQRERAGRYTQILKSWQASERFDRLQKAMFARRESQLSAAIDALGEATPTWRQTGRLSSGPELIAARRGPGRSKGEQLHDHLDRDAEAGDSDGPEGGA